MFTGLIEGIGEVREVRRAGAEAAITLALPASFSDCRIGDSVSVDGVCLTITEIKGGLIQVDLSQETLDRSTLGELNTGSKVNLERAMKLSDRLGGHLVSGHIDGTGILKKIEKPGKSWLIEISLDSSLSKYLIEKGSIAVDGISLTLTSCTADSFRVAVIPQTAAETTLLKKAAGSTVNLEIDMIAKYIEKFITDNESSVSEAPRSRIDRDMLAKFGFGDSNGRF